MKALKQSIIALLILTVITGIIYPLITYGIGQLFFNYQANGSIIYQNDKAIGSELIGQQFTSNKYFWSRPSATANYPYNGLGSGGSNLGPLNPQLIEGIKERVHTLQQASPNNTSQIPVDLVTASGSGLDPEISIEAAYYQMPRIAQIRHISVSQLQELVDKNTHYPLFGFLGEARVNVLKLNLALDKLSGE